MKRKLNIAALIGFASFAIAQEPQSIEESEFDPAVSESAPVLESLESTAFRFSADTLSVPVNSSVITREQIEASGAATVSEVLQREGNVMFKSFTGNLAEANASMRGFGENSGMRVLVIVDGQRYNRPDMTAINWLRIPLSNVESIEVLRGAQSAMYGDSAVAGVIKINTKKMEEGHTASIGGAYGSFGMYAANASVAGREGQWFYNVDLSRYDNDGFRNFSRAWATSANASLGYDFTDKMNLALTGSYGETSTMYPMGASWDSFQNNPRHSDGMNSLNEDVFGIYSATFKSETSSGVAEIAYGMNFRDREIKGRKSLISGVMTQTQWQYNDQWMYSVTPKYELNCVEDWIVRFGVDIDYADIRYHRNALNNFDGAHPFNKGLIAFANVSRLTVGPYGGAEYEATDNLTLSLSGRAETSRTRATSTSYVPDTIGDPDFPPVIQSYYNDSIWKMGLAASAGAVYSLTKESSVYARFDQVYRYPVVDEVAAYQGMSLAVPFNRDLNPETGQNYELGYKYIDENWTCNFNFFALYMQNEIMFDASPGVNKNVNADPTLRYGVDLEVRYDSRYWGASVAGTFVEANFLQGRYEDKRIPLVPMFNGVGSVYVKPVEWLRLIARMTYTAVQYQGNDFNNQYRRMPSSAVLDLQANITIRKNVNFFAAIENVTDEKYASFAYVGNGFFAAPGRGFRVGLTLTY